MIKEGYGKRDMEIEQLTTYTIYHFNNFVILSYIYFTLFYLFFILNDIYI